MTTRRRAGGSRRPRSPEGPGPQTLSLDWFTDIHDIHTVDSPLNNPPIEEDVYMSIPLYLLLLLQQAVESVDKSLRPDPWRCHSNLEEHEEGVDNCARTLRWPTDEILTGLDLIIGLEKNGKVIEGYGGYLWTILKRGRGGGYENRFR
jgi:hypothetical protein